MDRHSEGYYKKYRAKVKSDAKQAYGNRCSCVNCINNYNIPKSEIIKLRIFIPGVERGNQGQYGIAADLKRRGYPKDAAVLLCRECYMGRHLCDKQQYSDKHVDFVKRFRKQAIVRKLK